jgi:CRISPR/Cas system CMR-associated protein Cmr3 (group 5 of RAMP superfamily)
MSIPYLIKFTPVGRFYFGTSQSFGEGFYAVSSMFPSQTTVLGTLRAAILEKNNLLNLITRTPIQTKIDEVYSFTGKSQMRSLDEPGTVNDFGKILKLSPVFLVKQKGKADLPEDFLFPVPADVFGTEGLKVIKFLPEDKIKTFSRRSEHEKSYHYEKRIKDLQAEYLGGIQFWQEYKNNKELTFDNKFLIKNVFISDSQPGIARTQRQTKEEYYYIKKDFQLANDYSFGVIVHFTEENVIQDGEVFMGGERLLFKISLLKLPLPPSSNYSEHPVIKRFLNDEDCKGDFDGSKDVSFNNEKLVLFSPFIGDGILKDLEFAHIIKLYTPRSLNSRKSKSDSFRTIPAGSVLFPGNMLKKIKNYPVASKIGFNFALKF